MHFKGPVMLSRTERRRLRKRAIEAAARWDHPTLTQALRKAAKEDTERAKILAEVYRIELETRA